MNSDHNDNQIAIVIDAHQSDHDCPWLKAHDPITISQYVLNDFGESGS